MALPASSPFLKGQAQDGDFHTTQQNPANVNHTTGSRQESSITQLPGNSGLFQSPSGSVIFHDGASASNRPRGHEEPDPHPPSATEVEFQPQLDQTLSGSDQRPGQFVLNVRSATLPPEPAESPPSQRSRNLPFLLEIPKISRTPSAGAFPKSPAPSIFEDDLMDEILPHRIPVTVTMSWEGVAGIWKPEIIQEFLWIEKNSYSDLLPDKILRKHKEAEADLHNREIYHRHGSCRVKASPGDKYDTPYEILYEADVESLSEMTIKIICGFISNHPRQKFSLEVYWDSGSAQLKPLPGDSTPFKDIIKSGIRKKKQRNFRDQEYISRCDQSVFQQYDVVHEVVFQDPTLDGNKLKLQDSDKVDLVNTILGRPARKLWIICVYNGIDMRFLRHLLLEHKSSDKDPPRRNEHCSTWSLCQDQVSEILDSISTFSVNNVEENYSYRELESTEVMPLRLTGIESAIEELGTGASSRVYKVFIDSAHHYLSGDPRRQFALKEFPNIRRKYFEKEKAMLQVLANYPDSHIVLHLASWTQGNTHYILYPKAAYNLRDFMQSVRRIQLTRSSVLWFLQQLQGLAEAVRHVHHLKHPTNTDPNPDEDALWGCHYDIKPDNILVFEKGPNHYPSFKISDFGVGVFNAAKKKGQESELTTEAKGTEVYFAPDKDKDGMVSRPFDMWALGCVFLELMVWLFGFFESGSGFSTERFDCSGADPDKRSDAFWRKTQIDQKTNYVLKRAVIEALKKLETTDCVKLRAFLNVIEAIRGLLNVDAKKRWTSETLTAFLGDTIRQAQSDLERDPSFYRDQYHENCGGSLAGRELATERLEADVPSPRSTRSPSAASHRRDISVEGGQRPRSETRSSQAVIHTGSGTAQTSSAVDSAEDGQEHPVTGMSSDPLEEDLRSIT